jgi:CBS domain-containing protein
MSTLEAIAPPSQSTPPLGGMVREVMTKEVHSSPSTASVADVAQQMSEHDLRRVISCATI